MKNYKHVSDDSHRHIESSREHKNTMDEYSHFFQEDEMKLDYDFCPFKHEERYKHATILLVDDDESILESLCKLFEMKFKKCIRAKTGQEGLDEILMNNYDIIVSDLKMPEMDGNDFAEHTKILYETIEKRTVPFILHTAYPHDTIKSEYVDAIVQKPTDFARLLEVIYTQLDKS